MKRFFYVILLLLLLRNNCSAQQIPAVEENIPSLVTFGKEGEKSWGDDDFSQTWFFVIPKYQTKPIYIRVFDPDASGDNDEKKGEFNTKTQFTVYGGKTCFTAKDVKSDEPKGDYKSGNVLSTKTFTTEGNNDWYTFGPFNPTEGEWVEEYGGYIFKVISEGISGDDGNLYKYFLSESPTENQIVEGSNSFTFEYTFRLADKMQNTTHLYPYVDEKVIAVHISNFDFDGDGTVDVISITSKDIPCNASGNNVWATTKHTVVEREKKTTLDVQFLKNKDKLIKNNNVTLCVKDDYGVALPIFTVPIGGSPRSNYKIQFNQKKKTGPY